MYCCIFLIVLSPAISYSVLIELARLKKTSEQLRLWEEIKNGHGQLTSIQTTRKRKAQQRPPEPAF